MLEITREINSNSFTNTNKVNSLLQSCQITAQAPHAHLAVGKLAVAHVLEKTHQHPANAKDWSSRGAPSVGRIEATHLILSTGSILSPLFIALLIIKI